MSYVNKSLLPDEQVIYRTRLNFVIFTWPLLFSLAALAALLLGLKVTAAVLLVVAVIIGLPKYVAFATSEFAVTNKRLIVKVGVLRRRIVELQLSKVEAIAVDQSLLGRIFGYGDIVVTGTGGTKEPFSAISGPLKFRRAVQAAST
jgi:uncharacterized membrane protein YdbT with pleckstrin-like domain